MLDQLDTFAGQRGHGGYLVIFMGVALEVEDTIVQIMKAAASPGFADS